MFERLTDKNLKPSEDSILEYVGPARELWHMLSDRIRKLPRIAVEAAGKGLAPRILEKFHSTERLRDGRWLWARVQDLREMRSCAAILSAKAGGSHA